MGNHQRAGIHPQTVSSPMQTHITADARVPLDRKEEGAPHHERTWHSFKTPPVTATASRGMFFSKTPDMNRSTLSRLFNTKLFIYTTGHNRSKPENAHEPVQSLADPSLNRYLKKRQYGLYK